MRATRFLNSNRNLTNIRQLQNIYHNVVVDTKTGAVLDPDFNPIYETLYETLYWNPTMKRPVITDHKARQRETRRRYENLVKDIEDDPERQHGYTKSIPSSRQFIYMLHPVGWYPYGHLHDAMGRLYAWRNHEFTNPAILVNRYDRVVDFPAHVEAMGYSADAIWCVHKGPRFIFVPELYFGVNPAVYTTFTPESYEWLIGNYREYFGASVEEARLPGIYLSRNHVVNGARGVTNNQAVEDMLSENGFEIVTGREPLETIYSLFSRADVVVGAHGSLLVNTIFCRPDAKIVEYCPQNRPDYSFLNKYKRARDYEHHLRPADDRHNISIPVDELERFVTTERRRDCG